jgi:hypothetical protein
MYSRASDTGGVAEDEFALVAGMPATRVSTSFTDGLLPVALR